MATTNLADAVAARPGPRRQLARMTRRALPWLVILAIFLLWEGVVRAFEIESFVLPAPSAVFASAWEYRWPLLDNAAQTLMTTAIGFAIAVAFGLVAGIAVGSSRLVYDGFYPALVGFNSIPKVAVIPILVIWFGIGTVPAIITAFLISFFPILVNVAAGIATVEPELKDVLRALGASRLQMIRKVGLPRDAVFLRLPQGRDHLRLRRIDRRRDGRGQQGHRQPDAGRVVPLRGAARLRRTHRHEPDGHRDVSARGARRAEDHVLGDSRRRRHGAADVNAMKRQRHTDHLILRSIA